MSLRGTRRFKAKGFAISFGDFMLPLIGLAAIGLLFMAGRTFFFSDFQASRQSIPFSVAPPDIRRAEPEEHTGGVPSEASQVFSRTAPEIIQSGAEPVGGHDIDGAYRGAGSAMAEDLREENTREIVMISAPEPEIIYEIISSQAAPPETEQPQPYWMVQIGAFSTSTGAEAALRRITQDGYRARVISERRWHRVLVYAGPTNRDASSLAASLGRAGYTGAFAVPPSP